MVGLAYHTPAVTHPDSPALIILDSVLGSETAGRLQQQMVRAGRAASTGTSFDEAIDPGLFALFASVPKDGQPRAVEEELIRQAEMIAANPITDADVESAKRRLLNMMDKANATNVIGVANGLSEAIAAGDWRLWFYRRDALSRVTAADVNRVARTYLVRSNRTLARYVPETVPQAIFVPDAPKADVALERFKGRPATVSVERFDSSLPNIAARTRITTLGRELKVAMLPKTARGNEFAASMLFHFADGKTVLPYRDAARMAGTMLMRGTTTLTQEQLAARLVDLKARVQVLGSPTSIIVTIRAPRANLCPVMTLVADIIRNPRFDVREFEQLRADMIRGIEQSRYNPGTVVDTAMREHFSPPPGSDDEDDESFRTPDQQIAAIRALTLDDVKRFHREFYGTAEGAIGLVGDFDPQVAERSLTGAFANWPSKHPFVRRQRPFHEPAQVVRRVFETPDKANAVVQGRTNFRMGEDDPDYAAMMVASRIFGAGSKGSRLGDRIRERDGLSYIVGGGAIIAPFTDTAIFYMQASTAPENADRVEVAMREELAKFVTKGVTRAELDNVRDGYLSTVSDERSSDTVLASTLRTDISQKRDASWHAQREAAVRALTVEQVNAAIRRHVDPAKVSLFIAGDFARTKSDVAVARAIDTPWP